MSSFSFGSCQNVLEKSNETLELPTKQTEPRTDAPESTHNTWKEGRKEVFVRPVAKGVASVGDFGEIDGRGRGRRDLIPQILKPSNVPLGRLNPH